MKTLLSAATLLLAVSLEGLATSGPLSAAPDPDRAYVETVAQEVHQMVAACKKEIADGNRPELKGVARKILTVEQDNAEYLRAYEAKFNITHSP